MFDAQNWWEMHRSEESEIFFCFFICEFCNEAYSRIFSVLKVRKDVALKTKRNISNCKADNRLCSRTSRMMFHPESSPTNIILYWLASEKAMLKPSGKEQ